MDFVVYIIIGLVIGGLFFGLAAWGLNWSIKSGQFKNLDDGSRVVFDEEEPEGQHTDYFPGKGPKGGQGKEQ